ncbi:membrane dipeptidase [Thalassotalea psychrophila]|uniref:Membrane dipeptidase n=1 Tax=Thalassotalea psychrophila TaxID=3065647 RepID=A0ABY9TYG5_9GAMM|nr:membrane dipeptidase [Colwelliaceae bacterium SQ149]
MKFKTLLLSAAISIGCLNTAVAADLSKDWPSSKKADDFVKSSIVLDFFAAPYGLGWTEPEEMHTYLERAHQAGITGVSATLSASTQDWEYFQKEHALWRDNLLDTKDRYIFVKHVEDIERAHKEGKYAFIWNSQTSTIIDGDLSKIATLREMGLASMQLVYNSVNKAGTGVISAIKNDDGLTDWGKQIIDEMVKQGIVVDLSHTGLQTTEGVIAYMSKKHPGVPVLYTHSTPAGLYNCHPQKIMTEGRLAPCYRNITDQQAVAAAKTGGVVSPTFTEWMMDGVFPDDIAPYQAADMIDYYVKLVGVDHVGIATDDQFVMKYVMSFAKKNAHVYQDNGYMFDAFDRGAAGSAELAKILPAVVDVLWERGYTNDDLQKIFGGNVMRVYKQVWK